MVRTFLFLLGIEISNVRYIIELSYCIQSLYGNGAQY
jgi:hypothetical protein